MKATPRRADFSHIEGDPLARLRLEELRRLVARVRPQERPDRLLQRRGQAPGRHPPDRHLHAERGAVRAQEHDDGPPRRGLGLERLVARDHC